MRLRNAHGNINIVNESHPDLPSDEVVLNALDKTGFLLERDVYLAVAKSGLNAFIGASYPDPDDGTTREFDVLGIAGRYENGPSCQVKASVFEHVIIECKRWNTPLVGIGGPTSTQDRGRIPSEYSISDDPYRYDRYPERLDPNVWSLYHHLHFQNLPHPCADAPFLASQLVLMERKGGAWIAANTSLWNGVVLPLVKSQLKYALADKPDEPDEQSPSSYRYFSVGYRRCALVTTAPLIGVVHSEDGNTSVVHPKWFPAARELSLPYFRGRFIFEVVSAEHVTEWLSSVVVPHVDGMWGRIKTWSLELQR